VPAVVGDFRAFSTTCVATFCTNGEFYLCKEVILSCCFVTDRFSGAANSVQDRHVFLALSDFL